MPVALRLSVATAALLLASPTLVRADRSTVQAAPIVAASSAPSSQTGARWLSRLAPGADPGVLDLALAAMQCAQADGVGTTARRLAVIDYSRPSLVPRLWVFDLDAGRLLYEEVVAHGQGSGENLATR